MEALRCYACGTQPHVFPDMVCCVYCEAEAGDVLLWNNKQRNLRIYHETRQMCLEIVAEMEAERKLNANLGRGSDVAF